jgi:hypothetical protein
MNSRSIRWSMPRVSASLQKTLHGSRKSNDAPYPEKRAAEAAAKRVAGVHGLAEELKVELPSTHNRTDADIAKAPASALAWDLVVPRNTIVARFREVLNI